MPLVSLPAPAYPFQSGSRSVLARMNRPYTPEEYARLLAELRRRQPDLAVSTDLMVGFPARLKKNSRNPGLPGKQEFSRVHVFPFSPRRGHAPRQCRGVFPGALSRRGRKALAAARRGAARYRQLLLGKTEEVLLEEEVAPGVWEGLSGRYLRVRLNGSFTGGSLVPVRIISTEREPLSGRPLAEEEEKS